LGIDASRSFIDAANALTQDGELAFQRIEEGALTTPCTARVPAAIERSRATFAVGDALDLSSDLGSFDLLLMANLIDRVQDPARCLAQLPHLVSPGGQLIITSPYTWLEEWTPRERWLGGEGSSTFESMQDLLAGHFTLQSRHDLPFLIREHARKFQLGIADATVWRRR
jgi:SAM-dependent methyltransferase